MTPKHVGAMQDCIYSKGAFVGVMNNLSQSHSSECCVILQPDYFSCLCQVYSRQSSTHACFDVINF